MVLAAVLAAGGPASGAAAGVSTRRPRVKAPSDTVWLCRPHLAPNPCASDRSASLIAADGASRTERPVTARPRPVDCFYVYPTVSLQSGVNADLTIDPNQINVAKAQASRFSEVCRVYAPMYRQLTLQAIGGGITPEAAAIAYRDVRNAWRDYLKHHNHGRGVVLLGHSQGAGMLIQLVKQEIDPKPNRRARLASALLLGGNVVVPRRRDVGGDFKHIPACRKPTQIGCVVAFSTFDQPPPDNAIFGRIDAGFNAVRGPSAAKSKVLCVNPAALRGGKATVHPYFPAHLDLGVLGGALPAGSLAAAPTPWVSFPRLYTAQCREEHGASWLQVDDRRAAGDTRPRLVDSLGPTWGLHLVDGNIALGDLVKLAGRQGAAWSKQHRR